MIAVIPIVRDSYISWYAPLTPIYKHPCPDIGVYRGAPRMDYTSPYLYIFGNQLIEGNLNQYPCTLYFLPSFIIAQSSVLLYFNKNRSRTFHAPTRCSSNSRSTSEVEISYKLYTSKVRTSSRLQSSICNQSFSNVVILFTILLTWHESIMKLMIQFSLFERVFSIIHHVHNFLA